MIITEIIRSRKNVAIKFAPKTLHSAESPTEIRNSLCQICQLKPKIIDRLTSTSARQILYSRRYDSSCRDWHPSADGTMRYIFFSFTTHKNCRKISLFVFMFRGHICYIYSKCNAANEFFRCAYFYDHDNKKNGFRPYDTMSATKKMRRHKKFALSFVSVE